MYFKTLAMATATAVLSSCASAVAQSTAWCRTTDDFSDDLVAYVTAVGADTTALYVQTRQQLGVSVSTDVEHVTTEAICQTASAEYAALDDPPTQPAPVHVVRLGSTYAVVDPDATAGEWTVVQFFTDTWQPLGAITF